jgi:hypothetical protein
MGAFFYISKVKTFLTLIFSEINCKSNEIVGATYSDLLKF